MEETDAGALSVSPLLHPLKTTPTDALIQDVSETHLDSSDDRHRAAHQQWKMQSFEFLQPTMRPRG